MVCLVFLGSAVFIYKAQFDDCREEKNDSEQINKLPYLCSGKTQGEALLKYLTPGFALIVRLCCHAAMCPELR